MGGKGGGGGGSNFFVPPADTSGYGTLEEAQATLAAQKPLDMSKYQQAINVQKAAAAATAPTVPEVKEKPDVTLSEKMASSVLAQPKYWQQQDAETAAKPRRLSGVGYHDPSKQV